MSEKETKFFEKAEFIAHSNFLSTTYNLQLTAYSLQLTAYSLQLIMPYYHVPVMLKEVVSHLNCGPGKIYADCTLGGSGHAKAILERIVPDGLLIGIDQDKDAIANAENALKPYRSNIHFFHGNFIYLWDVLLELNIHSIDGILLDLGLSLHQLESGGRGFSFQRDEPLDMRMNMEMEMNAEYLVNNLAEDHLEKIFREYGEERWSRRVARRILKERRREPIRSSGQLARVVCDAIPRGKSKSRIHPATRVFMALRIAVNKELERLDAFMQRIDTGNGSILKPGARVCVLSFHSLEDRIVKHRMKALEKECVCPPSFPKCVCNRKQVLRMLTKKPQQPTREEINRNPLSRSAKLRVAEKV